MFTLPENEHISHLWKFGKSSIQKCLGKRGCVSSKGAYSNCSDDCPKKLGRKHLKYRVLKLVSLLKVYHII